ncbi:MAG: hypothetical protein QME81_11535 [bacterium]|nr:hypothetical protein [bacterium]
MNEKSYLRAITHSDRVRVTFSTQKGKVLRFRVQYTITPQHLRCPRECYDCELKLEIRN